MLFDGPASARPALRCSAGRTACPVAGSLMSIPSSCITRMANGCTVHGWVPALNTSYRAPPRAHRSPSAIWEREELCAQRKSTRYGCSSDVSGTPRATAVFLIGMNKAVDQDLEPKDVSYSYTFLLWE